MENIVASVIGAFSGIKKFYIMDLELILKRWDV